MRDTNMGQHGLSLAATPAENPDIHDNTKTCTIRKVLQPTNSTEHQ